MRRGVVRVSALFAVAFTILAGLSALNARADIADGGFESGYLRDAPEIDPSFGVWTRLGPSSNDVQAPLPVHSGQWSLQIDTVGLSLGSAVFQDFDSGTLSYVWTFWVFPQEGRDVAEIVYNWDRGAGYAEPGTEIAMLGSMTRLQGWGALTYLPPITLGVWHEVRVVADRCTGRQQVLLDGGLWGEIQAVGTPPAGVATIILGDVAYQALQGLYYFDDVSFETWNCSQPKPNACPLSQGFWKTHPTKWPVDQLSLGSETYAKAELLDLLRTAPKGDASLILAHQLIAAKLNIANGSDPDPVTTTISDADSLLSGYAGKLPYDVTPSSPAGRSMTALAGTLDAYNNGRLTPDCSSSDNGDPPLPHQKPGGLPRTLGERAAAAARWAVTASRGARPA